MHNFHNTVCPRVNGRVLNVSELYDDAKDSCIKMEKENGSVDYVVFRSKKENLVSIFPLSQSEQQCAQIQLYTNVDLRDVVKFGNSIAVAAGGRLFEFHYKSLNNYSAFFINEILNQKGASYKSVSSIEALPQSNKLLVTASGNTFVIDDKTVAPKSKRSKQIGQFHGVRKTDDKLDLN